jgi:hypothetical protein
MILSKICLSLSLPFVMKVLKLQSEILKFQKFTVDFSGKENGLFTSLQNVETLEGVLAHQIFLIFLLITGSPKFLKT